MGSLNLPSSGAVYDDANSIIYTVERHPIYAPLLEPLWQTAQPGTVEVICSELALMECLVGPLKRADSALVRNYESALSGTDGRMLPISQLILRTAAQLRTTTKLRTPDAIHAATSLQHGCSLFLTNDAGYRDVPGLPLMVLDDL